MDIPIDQIDDPDSPARETLDETKLHELIESIRLVGLIQPLTVEIHLSGYRVLAGHRRLIACRALGMEFVPCVVTRQGTVSSRAVTVHENAFREDLNPVEEARYFLKLLESECSGDVDKLVQLIRQKRDYIENRLLLLQGDDRVLDALQHGRISLGVAQELNKVQHPDRRIMYLDAAEKGGATIATVKGWRQQDDKLAPYIDAPANGAPAPEPIQAITHGSQLACIVCHHSDDAYLMELVYVHKYCRRGILDELLRNLVRDEDPGKE